MERFSDKKKLSQNNLTDTEKNAVEYFFKGNNRVIMKAGKGRATAFPDVKDYIAKAKEQLEYSFFSQKLNVDPTTKYSEIVNSTIASFRKQELSNITAVEVRTTQFHIFPKVHKTNVQVKCKMSK